MTCSAVNLKTFYNIWENFQLKVPPTAKQLNAICELLKRNVSDHGYIPSISEHCKSMSSSVACRMWHFVCVYVCKENVDMQKISAQIIVKNNSKELGRLSENGVSFSLLWILSEVGVFFCLEVIIISLR